MKLAAPFIFKTTPVSKARFNAWQFSQPHAKLMGSK